MIRIGVGQIYPKITQTDWNRKQLESILQEADKNAVNVLVLPELANSGYVFKNVDEVEESAEPIPDGTYCSRLREWSLEKRLVAAGICELTENGFSNSSALFADGKLLSVYRKIHLFSDEPNWFKQGDEEPPVIEWNGYRFGMMICFDWAFPETARVLALKGAQVILHPSNLVLKYCQNAMVTRSIENRVFTATANRVGTERDVRFTGTSQITAPNGEILQRLSEDDVLLGFADISPEDADNKLLGPKNDVFKKRRIELYSRLTDSL